MSRLLKLFAVVNLAMLPFSQISLAGAEKTEKVQNKSQKIHKNRKLLIKYKDGAAKKKASAHLSAGAYVVKSFEKSKIDVVEVARGVSIEAALKAYNSNPNVEYAEPDYELRAFFTPPPFLPPIVPPSDQPPIGSKDPDLIKQWGLDNQGQNGGKTDADINAQQMWELLKADGEVALAIIDTGINYDHPDLKNNIWNNKGEIPGDGIDNDSNGVIDDIHGYNAVTNSGDPKDDHGHGSHCAGIIAAENGNNFGGSGVMQKAQIIGCKFLDAYGSGDTSDAIECMEYILKLATREQNPVKIFATNNSWGGNEDSQALKDAIKAHEQAGILFFAAASNDSENNDNYEVFPANYYYLPNVVTVAATTRNDELAYFSNYGKSSVHLGSPGEDIYSTVLGTTYEEMSGTSMATPFALGLAGMIKQKYPDFTYSQIKNLLMAGGQPIPALNGKTISGRRIRAVDTNGVGSLTCENQIVTSKILPKAADYLIDLGESVVFSALNINCSEPNGEVLLSVSSESGISHVTLVDNGELSDFAQGDGVYTLEWSSETEGKYEFTFPNGEKVVVTVYDRGDLYSYEALEESTFSYREFVGTNTHSYDDTVVTVDVPFAIKFGGYNAAFNKLYIGSNGTISLTEDTHPDFMNDTLPASTYSTFISPYWDDLNPSGDKNIFYETLGEAPNREFVVEWRNVEHFEQSFSGQTGNGLTFQVVFFENSSDVLFNYLDTDVGNATNSHGASATIGIQTSNSLFKQYSFLEALVSNNKSIRFSSSFALQPPVEDLPPFPELPFPGEPIPGLPLPELPFPIPEQPIQ